jgi:hypothetical protein
MHGDTRRRNCSNAHKKNLRRDASRFAAGGWAFDFNVLHLHENGAIARRYAFGPFVIGPFQVMIWSRSSAVFQ